MTPISGVKIEVNVPTHFAQKQIFTFRKAEITKNDGSVHNCFKDKKVKLETMGKALAQLDGLIDCIETHGVRCVKVDCDEFQLGNDLA